MNIWILCLDLPLNLLSDCPYSNNSQLKFKCLYPQPESRDYSCIVAPEAGGEPPPITHLPHLDLFTESQLPCDIGSTEILLPPVRFHLHALLTDWHMGLAEQKCSLWNSWVWASFFFPLKKKKKHTKSRLNVLPSYKAHKNTSVIVEVFDFRPTAFSVLYINHMWIDC